MQSVLLTQEQSALVVAAEARARSSNTPSSSNRPSPQGRKRVASGCEDGQRIGSVSTDGGIVRLSDGSVWQVDAVDAIDSALRLPTTDVSACEDKLIDVDDGEVVNARRLR